MDFNGFIDKCSQLKNPLVDISRIERLLEHKGDSEFEGVYISCSKISSIRRFYESTNTYNRRKVADLINNNINNFEKVYRIVLDYSKVKNQITEKYATF